MHRHEWELRLDKEGYLAREPPSFAGEEWGGGLAGRPLRASLLLQMSRQRITLGLSVGPSTAHMREDGGPIKIEDRIQDVTKFSGRLGDASFWRS